MPKLLKSLKNSRKTQIISFALAFSVIATILLFQSFASPNDPPGDLNSDNTVSIFDLSILLANWNQPNRTLAQGDLNNDTNVNIFDLSILLANWGRTGSGSGGLNLPPPINPGDRDFGRIVRTTSPSGGVIVLPDGEYTLSDISNFNPANYVVVVAQNPLGAKVVRISNTIGQTDQYITGSSKIIFVGIEFKNIVTRINDSDDIYFWRTRHTFPITTHPDPDETYCGNGTGPDGVEIGGGSNRTGLYGVDIDDIGHDALKISGSSNVMIRGSKVMNVWHGNLQQGRGNSRCGWDGNDNYHVDGLQIFPGGVTNLTMEDSYTGRHAIPQVDNGGSSNTNLIFRRNMFYEEPPGTGCLAMNARVKPEALAGATQTMTFESNDAWCPDSQWLFFVEGSRHNALIINGEPIPSTAREVNRFLTRRTGTPDRNNTPAEAWRIANPYNDWPCYLQSNVQGFTQSVKSCQSSGEETWHGFVKPGPSNTGPTNTNNLTNVTAAEVEAMMIPGAVIQNVRITGGTVDVLANNVTIRNFVLDAGGALYGFRLSSGFNHFTLEDGEIYNMSSAGILGMGFTARRLEVHHSGNDAYKAQVAGSGLSGPVLVESSWWHHLGTADGAHGDGNQTQTGSPHPIVFRGNNCDMPRPLDGHTHTSCLMTSESASSSILFEHNWLNGGAFTIYCEPATNSISIRENRFGRDYLFGVRGSFPCNVWEGNVWDDTGEPVAQ